MTPTILSTDPRFNNMFLSPHLLEEEKIEKVDLSFGSNCILLKMYSGREYIIDVAPIGHGLYTPVVDSKEKYET